VASDGAIASDRHTPVAQNLLKGSPVGDLAGWARSVALHCHVEQVLGKQLASFGHPGTVESHLSPG
jgi:hypothetical protein